MVYSCSSIVIPGVLLFGKGSEASVHIRQKPTYYTSVGSFCHFIFISCLFRDQLYRFQHDRGL